MDYGKLNENQTFTTAELGLACYLAAIGARFLCVEPGKYGEAFFAFADEKGREEMCRAYWIGKASIEPQVHYSSICRIKAALRDFLRRQGGRS
jgi:hypothetical protein